MAVSRVSRKGLTSVPAVVRRVLGIEEGDLLVWEVDEARGVAIVRVIKNPVKYLRGKYSDPRITYESVEESADKIIAREVYASN